MNRPLIGRLTAAPLAYDPERAEARIAELLSEGGVELDGVASVPAARALLLGLADGSPYLWRLAQADPARLARLLTSDPLDALAQDLDEMRRASAKSEDRDEALAALRRGKQANALLVALADLGGVWDVPEVTEALTQFADAAVGCALDFLLRQARAAAPAQACGLVVLALGKQGARELNYSSDIDLIVLFDPAVEAPGGADPRMFFVRLTQNLARLLQERTGDGHALRVDLRLRPDPGSTAVAIALPAALDYYESFGQNWERAAMIKARPAAGDLGLGARFLDELAPFIWRKYFDYAAIADVHAMKRQIHAVRGHAEIAVAGHDVKLGRGGIREIEFFVQTQQLIFGGRRPQLRGSRTLEMLSALEQDGWISREAADELSQAYVFLRRIEHRLQMVGDEQTQRLPAEAEALARFARFCGFAGVDAFSATLLRHLERVQWHYARLFEHAPGLDSPIGNLVFTGVTDDPETLATLANLGFTDPARAAETIRGWHFGRRAAVQSARAREVLTELVPALLQSLAGSGDPDAGLAAFDKALARMPAAVELFTILKSNAEVRDLFADILGGAPRMAAEVVLRPHLLDGAIDPALLRGGVDDEAYRLRAHQLLRTPSTEDFLDGLRHLQHEEAFLIGVRALSGALPVEDVGRAYAALAQGVISAALARVESDFAHEHGRVPGGRCVVVGLGRLGSREMTAASDVDLILIYDFDDARPSSDGRRPLHAAQYYARLTQRLVASLSAPTRAGRLYAVDMRLRPSGGQGPVATRLSAFRRYQREEAETWEHMSLVRARVVAGDADLARDVEAARVAIVSARPDRDRLRADVLAMRRLVAREKGEDDIWDLKLVAGGLLDIEFIAQTLALEHGGDNPALLAVETAAILRAAQSDGLLDPNSAATLLSAYRLYSTVLQMARLTTGLNFRPQEAAGGVLRRIAASVEAPDFAPVEAELARARRRVRELFEAFFAR